MTRRRRDAIARRAGTRLLFCYHMPRKQTLPPIRQYARREKTILFFRAGRTPPIFQAQVEVPPLFHDGALISVITGAFDAARAISKSI